MNHIKSLFKSKNKQQVQEKPKKPINTSGFKGLNDEKTTEKFNKMQDAIDMFTSPQYSKKPMTQLKEAIIQQQVVDIIEVPQDAILQLFNDCIQLQKQFMDLIKDKSIEVKMNYCRNRKFEQGFDILIQNNSLDSDKLITMQKYYKCMNKIINDNY